MSNSREIPGAQTAQRVLQILRLLGQNHATGLTAQEIGAATGAQHSAVQRALRSLVEEGFVQRDPSQRRFLLGVESMHLGRATLQNSPLVAANRFALQKLARVTEDIVYLGVQMGDFVLCIHSEEGLRAMRVLRTRVGDLKPLGTTAGGLALMADMPDADIHGLYHRHVTAYETARLDFATLRQRIAEVRRDGYAVISDSVAQGVTGIGISLAQRGAPFATVSIGAMTSRMGAERIPMLLRLLREV